MVSPARREVTGGRPLRQLLWAGVAIAAVAGLARSMDAAQVLSALRGANGAWLALAALTVLASVLLKALRWAALLRTQGIRPSFGEVVRVHLIGQGLNTFLPLRVGEVARVQWLGRYDRARVLSTISIEKSADLAGFALMGAALLFGAALPPWLDARFRAFAVTTAAAIGALAMVLALSRERWLDALAEKITPLRPLIGPYRRFRDGWRRAAGARDVAALAASSAAVWLLAVATNLCLLAAFGAPASWISATVLLIVLQIGITIVTVPATIGIFEYLCVLTLGWFGVPAPLALSVGLVLHLLVLIPGAAGVWFARPASRAAVE